MSAPINTPDFAEIVHLIDAARQQAYRAVNTTLIELYWQVGAYISRKISIAEWGDGVVNQLAQYLAVTQPSLKGFTRSNLFRMRQFYETYQQDEKVAPLVRQLSWSHNLIILGQSKQSEEREFYLKMATQERWGKRELERQFKAALFERSVLSPAKRSTSLSVLHSAAIVSALLRQLPRAVKVSPLVTLTLRRHSRVLLSGIQRAYYSIKLRVNNGQCNWILAIREMTAHRVTA
jgi:predicted nuclease of restriction endonuclease-like (RecB) superfamily